MNPKEEYRRWCADKEQSLPIFLRPWLLDAVCENEWDVSLYKNKENRIQGVLPYFKFQKKYISVIGMPFLTPYMGIYIDFPKNQKLVSQYDFEKEVANALIEQIPDSIYLQQKFYPNYIYGLPFFWKGFRLDWRYTYHLSLQQDQNAIWEGMEGSARTQLLKTLKQVTIEISDDTRTLYHLVSLTFAKQSLKVPYTLDQFDRMYHAIKENNAGEVYLARQISTGKSVAGMFMVKDKEFVYNLVLGRDHDHDPGGSIHGVLWKCIQDHIGKHQIFDFEGSMLEGPERMFRSFGSHRVPVLQVTRYKNNFWRGMFGFIGK